MSGADSVDLAVIGGGPGGAACALEAARLGLSVALYEPEPGRDAPCGEGVMPAGADVLEALGLRDVVDRGRPFAGLRHLVCGAPPLEVDLPRPGVAIPRPALAGALHAALRREPRVRVEATRADVRPAAGGGFEVEPAAGEPLHARTLAASDGARGGAALWLRGPARERPPHRFGLRARFAEKGPLDRVEVHLGFGCEVYLTPLPEGRVNVALLFERAPKDVAGPAALLAWGLARHPSAAARLGALVTPPALRPLESRRPRRPSERGAFLVGDAGRLVDPIVGCGVTIALTTGLLAARGAAARVRGADPASVDRAYAAAFRRQCAGRHALATCLRRGDAHPRLARTVARVLRRVPRAGRVLARIAGGS